MKIEVDLNKRYLVFFGIIVVFALMGGVLAAVGHHTSEIMWSEQIASSVNIGVNLAVQGSIATTQYCIGQTDCITSWAQLGTKIGVTTNQWTTSTTGITYGGRITVNELCIGGNCINQIKSATQSCPSGQTVTGINFQTQSVTCSGGTTTQTNECPTMGTYCSDSTHVAFCLDNDGDGYLESVPSTACSGATPVCSNGACSAGASALTGAWYLMSPVGGQSCTSLCSQNSRYPGFDSNGLMCNASSGPRGTNWKGGTYDGKLSYQNQYNCYNVPTGATSGTLEKCYCTDRPTVAGWYPMSPYGWGSCTDLCYGLGLVPGQASNGKGCIGYTGQNSSSDNTQTINGVLNYLCGGSNTMRCYCIPSTTSCTTGQTRCSGSSVQTCTSGVWSTPQACASGSCTNGVCDAVPTWKYYGMYNPDNICATYPPCSYLELASASESQSMSSCCASYTYSCASLLGVANPEGQTCTGYTGRVCIESGATSDYIYGAVRKAVCSS